MNAIPLADIQQAAERIADSTIRTPLLRLHFDDAPCQIYLKLENLQPIGSFKLRGAGNAIQLADPNKLAGGVWTASAGNMAQGVAWHARRLGISCHVVAPDHAPQTKLNAIERLGGQVIPVPFATWWNTLVAGAFAGLDGLFIHPVSDPAVIAGNGTIGLEILRDLPDVAAIVIPYGGGGLSAGIASAIRAIKPETRIYAAEVESAAPLAASLGAGEPITIAYTPSFVDGIGGAGLLPEMWSMVSSLLNASLVVSLDEVRAAIRILALRARVIAEGAGAAGVAAALSGGAGGGRVVCVVSGGNIDLQTLAGILQSA